jgi:tripartite-type tricarboxylate transporter receptor subunit TctC
LLSRFPLHWKRKTLYHRAEQVDETWGEGAMGWTRRATLKLAVAAAATPVLPLRGDDWPSRPIKIIVGTAAGGSPDIVSRVLGERLAEKFGQSLVIENVTQGAGAVAQLTVSRAAPDGYTLGMLTAGYPPQMVLRKPPFDPLEGFSFVTTVCAYPMVYAVAPDSPIKSFADLLDQAKARAGKLTYTITAHGSIYHVLTKWIELESGASLTPIPYRGTAQAVTDVLSGRVDVLVDAATSAFPRIASKQVRVLALSAPQRYPLMPDAPIIAETLPKVSFLSWLGLAAPPGTPSPIIDRLNREVRAALTTATVQERLIEGGNIAIPSTPAEYRQKVADEMAQWRHVIEAGGIKAE